LGPSRHYAVAASPAYIAVLARVGVFGPPPEILLSGINRGANAGHALLHSGTVGAALTAANNGAGRWPSRWTCSTRRRQHRQ
jgi:5'-nucleotidase